MMNIQQCLSCNSNRYYVKYVVVAKSSFRDSIKSESIDKSSIQSVDNLTDKVSRVIMLVAMAANMD